jgi:hypothetical protein
MRVSLKNIIVPSIPLAGLLVVACCGLWLSAFFGERLALFPSQPTKLIHTLQTYIAPNTLISTVLSLTFTLFNAFLLTQINNKFTIIRTRTFLPLLVFMLLMSTWNETHIVNGSHVALTLFILSLFYFFSMVRNRNNSEQAFMGSFLISVSSILINPLIFIIPVCWIGFMMFQSLSLRTFLASIFGALAPWILYLSLQFFLNPDYDFSQAFVVAPNIDLTFSTFLLPRIIYIALIAAIMIISIIALYSLTHSDAIDTRNKLNFLVLLLFSFSVLSFLFKNQFVSFLPIIALICSLLISHPLTLKQNNFSGILFLVFCVINIAYVISKYILI